MSFGNLTRLLTATLVVPGLAASGTARSDPIEIGSDDLSPSSRQVDCREAGLSCAFEHDSGREPDENASVQRTPAETRTDDQQLIPKPPVQDEDFAPEALPGGGGIITPMRSLLDSVWVPFQVIGEEDRRPLDEGLWYPVSTVGKITIVEPRSGRTDGRCTGTLVGPRHVLTAGHCIFTDRRFEFRPWSFPEREDDVYYGERVRWLGRDASKYAEDDWAVVLVSGRPGDTYGWMGVRREFNTAWKNRDVWTEAGYAGDLDDGKRPWAHIGCSVRDPQSSFLFWNDWDAMKTDCDSTPGFSGSSLFALFSGAPYVVGLHNKAQHPNPCGGYDEDDCYNAAANATEFIDAVRTMRRDFP